MSPRQSSHHIMDFSLPVSWKAEEIEELFNSEMSLEYATSFYGDSWNGGTLNGEIEQNPVNFHLDTGAPQFFEATHSSLGLTEQPVNDEPAAGQDLVLGDSRAMAHGELSNTVAKEQNTAEYRADQEYGVETSPTIVVPMSCVEISATLVRGELTTTEITPLATDHEASVSSLVINALTSPSIDEGQRLDYQLETRTDGMKGPISMDHTHITCLVEGARALKELTHATPGDVTGSEAIRYEEEAFENADRDQNVQSAVPEHGSDQCYHTAGYSFSSQSATNDERLGIDVTEQQRLDVGTASNAGVDVDCEAGPDDISPSRRKSLNVRSSEAQVGPGVSDNEGGDGPARSGSLQGNSEGESDEMAQIPSIDTSGSKDNPILLDDEEEPPRRLSPPLIFFVANSNDSSVNDSDESSQNIVQYSSRPIRKKRKRCYDGMQAWGSAEFQESEAENLESAWLSVQTRWWAMETHVSELKDLSLRLERLAIDFNAYWFDLCVIVRQSGSIGASNVAQLINRWRRVEQELKTVQGNRKMKRRVLEFGQTLDWLEDKTVLYDCIEEYSNSIDRKDEDKDEDFEDEGNRHPPKTRRRQISLRVSD